MDVDEFVEALQCQIQLPNSKALIACQDQPNIYFTFVPSPTTTVIKLDLENADIGQMTLPPTLTVASSEGRNHGYWLLSKSIPTSQSEELAQRLVIDTPEADLESYAWDYPLRLPNTLNTKYTTNVPFHVKVTNSSMKAYAINEFDSLPFLAPLDAYWPIPTKQDIGVGPHEIIASLSSHLPMRLIASISEVDPRPLETTTALIFALLRLSIPLQTIAFVIKASASNPYRRCEFNADREVVKLVVRTSRVPLDLDAITVIDRARQTMGSGLTRNRAITRASMDYMKSNGQFIRTLSDSYFIPDRRRDTPIVLDDRSRGLATYMIRTLGMSIVETDYRHVISEIMSYGYELPITGHATSLSYYDEESNSLLLNTGTSILHVQANSVERVRNGTIGIVFPAASNDRIEPFSPVFSSDVSWIDLLLKYNTNVVNMTHDQLKALIRVWGIFTLFKNIAPTRPILLCLGQPGSGKTTFAKILSKFFFGPNATLSALTNQSSFDVTTSNNAIVVFDNADSRYNWLADRLAQMLSDTHVDDRSLYTNNTVYRRIRGASIVLTAHDPQFTRPDVVQRLLIASFRQLKDDDDPTLNERISEVEILHDVVQRRNEMWGSILHDVQRVLGTPRPAHSELTTHVRVEDFAHIGLWIARALEIEEAFLDGLRTMHPSQSALVIEDDQILVDSMLKYIHIATASEFKTVGNLYIELRMLAEDPFKFEDKYRNAGVLARRLWSGQGALKQIANVEWVEDKSTGRKLWRIC